MKRVIIVHGWGGTLKSDWYGWLKHQLESKGLDVELPLLPNTHRPRIETWVHTLSETVGEPDEQTYLVGHSLGCQNIARYLETLPDGIKVGGVVFVAGFFDSLYDEDYDDEDKETERHWLDTPLNFDKVKSHINKSVAFFSEDDPDVPLENKKRFESDLGSEVIILNGYKHFNKGKLPIVLEKLLEISK